MTVRKGVLVQTSVSEIESFDHEQEGGCERRWWFERPMELRGASSKSQVEGEALHAHLAHYLLTGERPTGRKLMGKAAMGAIVKGALPELGPDLFVELRFDGQEKHHPDKRCTCGHPPSSHVKGAACIHVVEATTNPEGVSIKAQCGCDGYSAKWLPLDVENTLTLAGVPLEGFIDLTFRRGPIPEIWDHKKFTPARPEISPDPYVWLKKPSELIRTVQMPTYVLSQLPYWPDAKQWRLVHHCVSNAGTDSQVRSAIVSIDQVLERKASIEATIERMKVLAPATSQQDIPFNRRSCSSWGGCPHQSVCSAFKKETTTAMALTADEEALFADLDETPAASAPAADPDFDGLDEVATPAPAPAPEPAKPARRMLIVDTPVEGRPIPDSSPAPQPEASAPAAPEAVICGCGEKVTAENGSKLQSGEWKHIGCKLNAPKVETPAPRARGPRKPKETAAPAPEPKVETPAPKAETAKAPPVEPAPTAPVKVIEVTKPAPAVEDLRGVGPAAIAATVEVIGPNPEPIGIAREANARIALAETFEGIAKLLRSVA